MAELTTIAMLIGQLLFGGFFVLAGVNHITKRKDMVGYAAAMGLPAAGLAVIGTGVLLFVGGTLVATGLAVGWGAAAIAVFLVGVTPVMHAFWKISDPAARAADQQNFIRNLALLGAALAFIAIAL